MVEAMADDEEAGYDVDEVLRRRGGRPAMGSSAASVESVRLDPELRRDLILRAAKEHISVDVVEWTAACGVELSQFEPRPTA